jgi:hypothetical protein
MDQKSGSGIRNEQLGSHFIGHRNQFFGVKILKNSLMRIREGKNLDPGWKNSDPGWKKVVSGIRINIPGLKYLNSLMRIRDPGWKKVGSGMEKSRIRDPDKHPGSATLVV